MTRPVVSCHAIAWTLLAIAAATAIGGHDIGMALQQSLTRVAATLSVQIGGAR